MGLPFSTNITLTNEVVKIPLSSLLSSTSQLQGPEQYAAIQEEWVVFNSSSHFQGHIASYYLTDIS